MHQNPNPKVCYIMNNYKITSYIHIIQIDYYKSIPIKYFIFILHIIHYFYRIILKFLISVAAHF